MQSICDEHVYGFVRLALTPSLYARISHKLQTKLHQILCMSLTASLSPPLAALEYALCYKVEVGIYEKFAKM